jgi:cellulose synthase/poly-beta-1,6-N-acetylglucosamine synthase-like glycosyltransferase
MNDKVTNERPLVTFALFAYNQEQYIREAVEGAFSQTYEPLEIVLSDDCSTDRTFEIMQEMAAGYKGPHDVRVRQSEMNAGIIDHVISVARMSKGELLIVAAGDDISKENRSCEIVGCWLSEGSTAIYSALDECDDSGKVLRANILPQPLERVQELFYGCSSAKRHNTKIRNIPGYSAAYKKKLLSDLPLTETKAHNEDALTTYLVNLQGGVISVVPQSLMMRRISDTSISAKSDLRTLEDVKNNELVIQSFSASTLRFHKYFANLESFCNSRDFQIVLKRLNALDNYYFIVANFWSSTNMERLKILAKVRSKNEIMYILPRILGLGVFCRLKLRLKKRP